MNLKIKMTATYITIYILEYNSFINLYFEKGEMKHSTLKARKISKLKEFIKKAS